MSVLKKNIASVINTIFHPLCIPIYIIILFLYCNIYTSNVINTNIKLYVLLFMILVSIIIPSLCFFAIKKARIYVPSEENKKLWTGMFACMMAIIFFAISRSFTGINMPWIMILFFLWNAMFIFLCGLVSVFAKINFYAIGIGEIIALYIWFMKNGLASNQLFLFILIFLFGIIGWAQIITNKSLAINYCLETLISILFVLIALGFKY